MHHFMENPQTISWIFLAIALCSQTEPVDFKSISQIADGINHAVPTEKEMQSSISWLKKEKFIVKVGNKYSLSESGQQFYLKTVSETKGLLEMWRKLENEISNVIE